MNKKFSYIAGLLSLLILGFINTATAQESSNSLGNVFIHSEGNMTEFNNVEFSNENNGSQPGIIGGERVPSKGYFNFAPGAGWTNAKDLKFIDGYARYFGNAPFLFPIGDNNRFRPAAVSGGSYVEAAYYGIDPTSAVTSDIRGGDFPILPSTGPFASALHQDIITEVSEWEYWDINGTDPTIITLTWDQESFVNQITNNDLERLTIVGWNGTEWEAIPSEIDFRTVDMGDYEANFNGSTPTLESGSISTTSSLIPSEFEVYTLAASCINMDLLADRSVLICLGQEDILTATSTFEEASIVWSTQQTGNSIVVQPTENTIYTVTATVGGCEVTREIDVTVKEVFVDIGQDTFICRGQELILSPEGTSNALYQWDDGNTIRFGEEIAVNLNTPTDIFLTVTDSDGCTAEDQIFVTVRDAPDVDTGRDRRACLGDTVFLQATGSIDGLGYQWSTGDTMDFIWVSPTETTIYEVSLTDNGCTDVSFASVEIFPEAFVEIVTDSVICGTNEITIETDGTEGRYDWSNGDMGESITVTPADGETYAVTITSDGNCRWEDEITFNVYSGAELGDDISICQGQEVNLQLEGLYETILWSDGSTADNMNVQPTQTTTYTATTTYLGCTGTDEITVNVTEDLEVDLGPDINVCKGELVTLSSSVAGQYFWSNGMNSPSITIVPFITTTYSVTVYSGDCEATDEITVIVDDNAAFVNITTDPLICPGAITTLTTDGIDGIYEWSNGNFGQSLNVSGIPGDSYTVTVTAANGCTATDNITLLSFSDDAVDLGEDKDICIGESLSLEADGYWDSVEWSNGSTNNFINITPLSSETYSVTVTKDNCTSIDEVTINVGSSIELDLGEDIFICSGESLTLGDDSVSGDFAWDTGQTSTSIEVSPSTTTTYSASVVSGNCNSSDEITVFVEDIFVNIEGDDIFCAGETVTLSASGTDGDYRWSTGVTGQEINITPVAGVSYSVTLTSDSGCEAIDEFIFQEFDENQVSIGEDLQICIGETVTLGLSGLYDTATWSDGSTGGSLTVTPNATTTYSVTAQLGSCEITDEVTVEVVSQLDLDLGNDIVICNGQEVELTSNVAGNYTWSNGFTGEILTVSPTQTTLYSVTITSGSCNATDNITVIVEDLANISIAGNSTICNGEEVTISAVGSQGEYLWNTGETTKDITLRPLSDETYSVTVTTATGCTASDEITFSSFDDGTVNLGPDVDICIGGEATLALNGTFDRIEWSNGSTAQEITVSPDETTSYSVVAYKGACQTSDIITVNVFESIDLNLGNDITICGGQEVTLSASITGDYEWDNGATTSTLAVSPLVTTSYSATVTSGTCTSTDEITVVVENMAIVEIVSDTVFCPGDNITLTAQGSPGTYSWNTGATGESTTFTPTDNTVYSVTVTTDNGCQVSDQVMARSFESNYVDLGDDIVSCTGEETILELEGTYDEVLWSTGETTSTITVNPSNTTSYSVTASFNGCEAEDDITVEIVSELDLDLGPDRDVCIGQRIELESNISGDYLWSTGERTKNIFVTPNATTTYSVTITSGSCTTEDAITLNVTDSEVTITGDNILCEGGSVDLTAEGPSNAEYSWSNGDSGQSITLTATPNVSYRVTMTTPSGCTDTDEIIFTLYDDTDIEIGSDLSICAGEEVDLSVTGLFDEVEWSTGENQSTITVSPTQTTTYSLVSIYGSCSTSDEITINVVSELEVDLGSDIVSCAGDDVVLQDLDVFGTFEWSTGANTAAITVSPTTTTTYSVTVTSGSCSDIDEVTVVIQDDCLVDLSIEKTVDNFSPKIGDLINFQVAVTNSSNTVNATNVIVDEKINSGYRFIDYESTAGIYNVNTSKWYIDEVESNTTEILTITVEVLSSGDYTNTATIIGVDQDDPDSDPDDPEDDEDDTVTIDIDVTGGNNELDNTSSIGDLLWDDKNGNGYQEPGERGMAGITVNLYSASNINIPILSMVTDDNGNYLFENLSSGEYFVEFIIPEDMIVTEFQKGGGGGGNTADLDSDINNIFRPGTTAVVTLAKDEDNMTLDGGIYKGGSIGDYVWFDVLSGISSRQDDMLDSGQPDITMHLLTVAGDTLATTITDENGFYSFNNLPADKYIVAIEVPADKALVIPNQFGDEIDSDFNVNTGLSVVVDLDASENIDNLDAGLSFKTVSLTLNDFWGERIHKEKFNRLFWSTEAEVNTWRFIIERSIDTPDEFRPIGEVEAAGESAEKLYYSFDNLDSRDAGLYYYRLVMQDLDGSQTYSKIITINVLEDGAEGDELRVLPYKVYPIPTYDFITLEIESPADYSFTGYLVNNLGQNVRKISNTSIQQGLTQIKIDVAELAQGEYYLNFYIGEKQYLSRILKLDY
ncbi:hypothetical protein N9L92_01725 [Saprospiraceae bacterium]|nr:hypothetical protein [Saprospiraceae bacterium]